MVGRLYLREIELFARGEHGDGRFAHIDDGRDHLGIARAGGMRAGKERIVDDGRAELLTRRGHSADDATKRRGSPKIPIPTLFKDISDFWEMAKRLMESSGWGTWIRTRTNGVRVRGSTVNLFPSRRGWHRA